MQGPRPSLKEAFSGTGSNQETPQQIPKKTPRGKKCTAHFGCANMAVSQEPVSGTLYCNEHKPKQVTVQPINIQEKKKVLPKENSCVSFIIFICRIYIHVCFHSSVSSINLSL